MTTRVVELFAGIGAQAEALKELGIDYTVIATSDIDKNANIGYQAIHGKVDNLGDITKIDHLPECDLLTYSWPCTNISVAGKREGMIEGSGTASSLLWEVGRLLQDMSERGVLPEILVAENVEAIINKDNKAEFDRWIGILNQLGYCNSYSILDAKDYGTPQNRRRMFMVSTRTMGEFVFPKPCPDGRTLKDILETDVPESFFLSQDKVDMFKDYKENDRGKSNKFQRRELMRGGIPDLENGDCKAFLTPGRTYKAINGTRCKKDDVAFTITKEVDGILQKEHGSMRIRYFTPRECLRLQSFPDEAIDKLYEVLSKSALYKVAGNTIAVCCLKAIFKGIFIDKSFRKDRQTLLEAWL